jgi:hypothetical protein
MRKRLFILVEGEDDIRFFGRIIKPLVACQFASVEIIPYACIKRVNITRFLKSVHMMGNDYLFFADIDDERSVRDKKQILYCWFNGINGKDIIVVIKEIESWYYAGIPDDIAVKLGIPVLADTNDLTKEDFNRLIPLRFDSRIDFMFEILKYFSLETAVRRNQSFRFFIERYHLGHSLPKEPVPSHPQQPTLS